MPAWRNAPSHPTSAAELESYCRDARIVLLYDWLTPAERATTVANLVSKYELRWALRCLVAFRTGRHLRTMTDVKRALAGSREASLFELVDAPPELLDADGVAGRLNTFAHDWLREVTASLALRT